jgi:hypothetical protein
MGKFKFGKFDKIDSDNKDKIDTLYVKLREFCYSEDREKKYLFLCIKSFDHNIDAR